MTKNEIVVRWINEEEVNFGVTDPNEVKLEDYNMLHEAWVKFRDLSFVGLGLDDLEKRRRFSGHQQICDYIREAITDGTITEAFDELVKGIEWYNSLNKQ